VVDKKRITVKRKKNRKEKLKGMEVLNNKRKKDPTATTKEKQREKCGVSREWSFHPTPLANSHMSVQPMQSKMRKRPCHSHVLQQQNRSSLLTLTPPLSTVI
jgi:hypothetical protein